MYSLTIPGKPKPKGRPRARVGYKNGKPFAQIYTPGDTVQYEREVALAARKAIHTPLVGELRVIIRLYFKGRVFGDTDNCEKSILDGLQGVAFTNDKQICDIRCYRVVGDPDERAEVEIEEIGGDAA